MKCRHRRLVIETERDACSWVRCVACKKEGPKKHSYGLALMAWLVSLADGHPRAKVAANRRYGKFAK